MEDYKKLCTLILGEVNKEVAKNSLSPDAMRTIGVAIDTLKDIKEMERDERMEEQGYSEHYPNRGWNIMPYYAYDDMSYAPRRRDDMGRFMRSRDSYDGSYDDYEGRSNRRGYSRDAKIEQLEDMMNHAKNDAERESIRKLIVQMENG